MKNESTILAELCPKFGDSLVFPELPGYMFDISFVNARELKVTGYLPEGRVELLLSGCSGPYKPLKNGQVWRRKGSLIFLLKKGEPLPI